MTPISTTIKRFVAHETAIATPPPTKPQNESVDNASSYPGNSFITPVYPAMVKFNLKLPKLLNPGLGRVKLLSAARNRRTLT